MNTRIERIDLLEEGFCDLPDEGAENTPHDFLVQNYRPDLVTPPDHEHALRFIDFP